MVATEFQIDVNAGRVRGFFGRPGTPLTPTDEVALELDELTMETVAQLDALLNYWSLIVDSRIPQWKALLGKRTVEVIGKQMWRLLLDNKVGDALVAQLDEPDNQPLRLLLAFDANANSTLQGLPWEFLFEPRRHGFLCVKTNLLLTRYVPPTDHRRPRVETVQHDELRVLLLAALPKERGRDRADRHNSYWLLERALRNVSGLDVKDLGFWDKEAVKEAMSSGPPVHIVHVVGICRGAPGAPKIYLGGEGDGFEDPEELVKALTGPGAHRPQLVILHLCDYEDGDATENFERLAPALIKNQVPAVLALQYAALADEVGVGEKFYRRLLAGERIGEAVQTSRAELGTDDRRFGTPVLYLGDDGPLRKPPRKAEESGSSFAAATFATKGTGRRDRDLRQVLLKLVTSARGLSGASRSSLIDLVTSLPGGAGQESAAREAIRLELIGRHDEPTFDVLGQMLIAVRDEMEGAGRGQG